MRNFDITFNKEENCVIISPVFTDFPRLSVHRLVDKYRDDISVNFFRNQCYGVVLCEGSKSVSQDSDVVRFVIEQVKEIYGRDRRSKFQMTANFNWNLALNVFSFLGIDL